MQDMFKDDITQSIAKTVSDVLEGKVKKEEMDPTDHVKNKDGQFVVVDANGEDVKAFGKKDEADAYAKKNHEALMAVKKESPEEPKPAGEKKFKDAHKVKKSGEKEDGTVVKEESTISIDYMHKIEEKLKPGKGKTSLDIDYIGDKDLTKKLEKKFKVKIKITGQTTADVSGDKKMLLAFLKSDAFLMDDDDVEEYYPELLESKQVLPEEDKENGYMNLPEEDLSPKQKEYQKVFKAAMKKFGVKSPADFKDDAKKKEFFDYIDKNYKAEKEED